MTLHAKHADADTSAAFSEQAYSTLEAIADAVIATDPGGVIRYCNSAAGHLLDHRSDALLGQPLARVIKIVDEFTGRSIADPVARCMETGEPVRVGLQNVLETTAGKRIPIEGSAAPSHGSNRELTGVALVLRDVTPGRNLLREMTYRATHDALTRLVNRQEFERRVERVVRETADNQHHALLFMDLNRFKSVNDTYGHAAGDELLRQIAELFSSRLRTRDTLARLGGDEFGLLLEHCPGRRALQAAHRMRDALQGYPFRWRDVTVKLDVSIGMVPITARSPHNLEVLLSAADRACYAAKDAPDNGIHVFSFKTAAPAASPPLPAYAKALPLSRHSTGTCYWVAE